SRTRLTLESANSTTSGRSTIRLSLAGPSTTIPRMRAAVATPKMVTMNHRPVRRRRAEIRQPNVMRENPRGNAPKPTRMLVTVAADPREILNSAAVRTGSAKYFTAIAEKMTVAASSTKRLSQGTKRHLLSTIASALVVMCERRSTVFRGDGATRRARAAPARWRVAGLTDRAAGAWRWRPTETPIRGAAPPSAFAELGTAR